MKIHYKFRQKYQKAFLILVVCAVSLIATWAHATLGETEKSIALNAESMTGSTHSVKNLEKYVVHKIQSDGVNVKEYTNNNGVVFAVSWRGIHHLDFEKFFGNYYSPFKNTLKTNKRTIGRRSQVFKGDNLVIQMGGHMKAVHGYAVIPSLLPQKISISDLKLLEK